MAPDLSRARMEIGAALREVEASPAYGRREPWIVSVREHLLAAASALGEPPPPPPPPPPAQAGMFDTAGLIVVRASNFPPTTRGVELARIGFRRACTQIYSGIEDDDSVRENLGSASWYEAMDQAGYVRGGWAVIRLDEPFEVAAQKIAARLAALAMRYLILDTEALKDDQRGDRGSWSLVEAFGRALPDVPIGAVTFGEATGDNVFCQPSAAGPPIIDFRPYQQAGWPYLVEAYEGPGNYVDPVRVVEKALRCGWTAERVKPAIVSTDRAAEAAGRLAEAHARHGIRGFEVWDAANLTTGFAELQSAIVAGAALTDQG